MSVKNLGFYRSQYYSRLCNSVMNRIQGYWLSKLRVLTSSNVIAYGGAIAYSNAWFPAFRIRCRKAFAVAVVVPLPQNPCPYRPFMPLLLGPVRGNSAAGPGARAPSFPRKRAGGAPGRRNGIYGKIDERMNGNGELTETKNVIFYVSYGVRTEFLRINVILTYFCNGQRRYGNGGTDT